MLKGWNDNNQGGSRYFYKRTNSELLEKTIKEVNEWLEDLGSRD